LRLVAAHLLVERVENLLPGGGAGERRAVVQCPAEAPEVEEPLRRPVEGHPHPVQQVDDPGRRVAHPLDGGLVGQKVAAVDRIVEVDLGGVSLALDVDRAVDAALGADRVGALDRDKRDEVDLVARLGQTDRGHQSRKTAADDDELMRGHPGCRLLSARRIPTAS
jgi:hypothetical protein